MHPVINLYQEISMIGTKGSMGTAITSAYSSGGALMKILGCPSIIYTFILPLLSIITHSYSAKALHSFVPGRKA